jgi:hypothetical protein
MGAAGGGEQLLGLLELGDDAVKGGGGRRWMNGLAHLFALTAGVALLKSIFVTDGKKNPNGQAPMTPPCAVMRGVVVKHLVSTEKPDPSRVRSG